MSEPRSSEPPSATPPTAEPGPASPRGVSLRPVVGSSLDAEAAWLRASVEAFEPRLRELEGRDREGAGPGAWTERPDLSCGWGCRCCPPPFAGPPFLDLDRWWQGPPGLPGRWGRWPGGADDAALERRLERAVARNEPVVLGAARDPYAGDAAHRARTRRLLEVFRHVEGIELAVTTASPLVLCDLDLLTELDAASSLSVEMVVPAADAALARRLEPTSAPPGERLGALEEVAAQGLATRLRLAPLMPGLNAGEETLRPLMERAVRGGAVDVAASPLRLPLPRSPRNWAARRRFFAWLAAQEPELLPRYRRLYRFRRTLPKTVRHTLQADFERLRLAHGFPRGVPGRS